MKILRRSFLKLFGAAPAVVTIKAGASTKTDDFDPFLAGFSKQSLPDKIDKAEEEICRLTANLKNSEWVATLKMPIREEYRERYAVLNQRRMDTMDCLANAIEQRDTLKKQLTESRADCAVLMPPGKHADYEGINAETGIELFKINKRKP